MILSFIRETYVTRVIRFVQCLLFLPISIGSNLDVYDCSIEEYQCFSGQCIPSNYFCDYQVDCDDHSDENHCYTECIHPSDPDGEKYVGNRNISSSGATCLFLNGKYCTNYSSHPNEPSCNVAKVLGMRTEACDIPICRKGSIDCDFEVDLCNWLQHRGSDSLWIRQKGSLPGEEYSRDMNLGYFIIIKMTESSNRTTSAILLSPALTPPSSGEYCLSFSFSISGVGFHSLNIYAQDSSRPMVSIWSIRESTYGKWNKTYIAISQNKQFGVIVEGQLEERRNGYIAVDDFLIEDGKCPFKGCSSSEFQCNDGTCIEARYFCDVYPDCPDHSDESNCHIDCLYPYDTKGMFYKGTINTSLTGEKCTPWAEFNQRGFILPVQDENYCRTVSPMYANYPNQPWCFTSITLDYNVCGVPECEMNCLPRYDPRGLYFRGDVRVSSSGKPCIEINNITSNKNNINPENVCRNPNSTTGPWCYVESGNGTHVSESCRIRNCTPITCNRNEARCLSGQCIKLDSPNELIVQCYASNSYVYMPTNYSCPNDLYCRGSQICLPQIMVCDGIPQCPYHDDESDCVIQRCPQNCSCSRTTVTCKGSVVQLLELPFSVKILDLSRSFVNIDTYLQMYFYMLIHTNLSQCHITYLPSNISFGHKSRFLRTLDLSHNGFQRIPPYIFAKLTYLRHLFLDGNPITNLTKEIFSQLPNLEILSISATSIKYVEYEVFVNLDSLIKLNMMSNLINMLGPKTLNNLGSLLEINLAHSNLSNTSDYFVTQVNLQFLDLSFNSIKSVTAASFMGLYSLIELNLDYNFIDNLNPNSFASLDSLRFLSICNNMIHTIETGAFHALISLQELQLRNNHLDKLDSNVFEYLSSLRILNLASNSIYEVQSNAFIGLNNLFSLNVQYSRLVIFKDMFRGLNQLQFLYGDSYTVCCARPLSVKPENCIAPRDKISSCEYLIDIGLLSVMIWFMAFGSLLGNAFVIMFRSKQILSRKTKQKNLTTQNILVLNLSIADMFMGLYLSIIAVIDLTRRGEYGLYDREWRHSTLCTICGIIATTSSEASAMFITFITLDRVIVLRYPFSKYRLTAFSTSICVVCLWLLALVVSILPLVITSYFQNEFYSATSVCISLPLSTERSIGWEYSVGLFIGFNFVLFCGIIVGQLAIYKEVSTVGKSIHNATKAREVAVAKSLTFIVVTDIMCWVPIAVIGLITLGEIDVESSVFAWIVVFVLPINSALNPFLYTFSAIYRNRRKNHHSKPPVLNTKESYVNNKHVTSIYEGLVSSTLVNKYVLSLERFTDTRSLTIVEISRVAVKVAEELDKIHSAGFVHGNISKDTICVVCDRNPGSQELEKNDIHLIADEDKLSNHRGELQRAQDIKDYGRLIKHLVYDLKHVDVL